MSSARRSTRLAWVLVGIVLVIAAAAVGVKSLQHGTQPPAREQPPAAQAPAAPGPAARSDSGHARIRVISETPTALTWTLTWSDDATAEASLAIQPGRHYTPAPAEAADAARAGRQTFAGRLSSTTDSDGNEHVLLEYFVPIAAFPEDLRQQVFAQPPAAWYPHLIRAAWAQDEGGLGAAMSMGAKFSKGYHKIESALDKSEDNAEWMEKLDALEECARNPTQTVTQNAYRQDPQYQQRTLDAIADARSTVQQATGLRFLNLETSVASGFVSGPLKKAMGATGSIASWNDAALKDIATRQIADVSKLVDCDLAPPPSPKHGDGTIKYHMRREGYLDYDQEEASVRGTFDLGSIPGMPAGYVDVTGDGGFKYKNRSSRFQTSNQCEGTTRITGGGNSGELKIDGAPGGGGCVYTEAGKASNRSATDSDTAFSCLFHDVDLVNGGSYTGVVQGEESQYATCELDLTPQRK